MISSVPTELPSREFPCRGRVIRSQLTAGGKEAPLGALVSDHSWLLRGNDCRALGLELRAFSRQARLASEVGGGSHRCPSCCLAASRAWGGVMGSAMGLDYFKHVGF